MSLRSHYILRGREIVECDLWTWARWFETTPQDRIVLQEQIGVLWVSTVFLGLDHNFSQIGQPILFETMILDDGEGLYCTRCATYAEAEAMHLKAVEEAYRRVEAANAMTSQRSETP